MRRVAIVVVLLAGLLVVADRVAVSAAQRDVARRIQASQGLAHRPDVHIGGFPFLGQMVEGRYDDVDVTVRDLRAGPLRIDRLTTELTGARVPIGDVIRQRIGKIPTDEASAEVLVSYDDLNQFLEPSHVRLSEGAHGRVHVTATAEIAGTSLSAGLDVPIAVSGSVLTIEGPAGIQLHVPLSGLPFRLRLDTAKATDEGVVVGGSAEGLVLRP